ncbi:MAG: STAS/SEC14 domain-containing protein [Phycisphaerae bacterium]
MSVELAEQDGGRIILVSVRDKLVKEDYEQFVPEVERLIQRHGKIRVLFEMQDFHGWSAGALWEDVKFDVKHFNNIDRVAVVGEKRWQDWMSTFCRPFTTAQIRYFDAEEADAARDWIHGE